MDFFFAPDLRSFIDDNPMIDLDTACDFVCEKFNINLTDSLLDEIAEVFFEHEDVAFRLGLSWSPVTPTPPHFSIMTVTEFATLSNIDLVIAEVQGKVKVTRLATVKPRKSDLIMTQTKGNRCRTNRSSGTNFVTQVRWVSYTNSPEYDSKLLTHSSLLFLLHYDPLDCTFSSASR